MVAQHVHHAHHRHGHLEELGALCHAGTHQQTAVAATHDGQFVAVGVFLLDQVFGRGNEVVEHVLFVHLGAGDVPLLAIFVAATQTGHHIDAALLQERYAHGGETRVHADVEATVAVEQQRVLAIALHAFFICNEQRDACAVLAGAEHLLAHIIVELEGHLGCLIQGAGVAVHVVAVNGAWHGVGGEGVETLLLALLARKIGGSH